MKEAIICIDDEAIILMSLKMELKQHFGSNFYYESASSAEEAEEILNELAQEGVNPAVVVSDWLMPGAKGDEFLRKLHKTHQNAVKVLITGQADDRAIQDAIKSGAIDASVEKPWNAKQLMNILDECVEKKRLKK